jgi:hypothetical protein
VYARARSSPIEALTVGFRNRKAAVGVAVGAAIAIEEEAIKEEGEI